MAVGSPKHAAYARLDVLGIEPRVAQKFTQAAIKFSNAPSTAHLLKSIGNQSKLFEMLVLLGRQRVLARLDRLNTKITEGTKI